MKGLADVSRSVDASAENRERVAEKKLASLRLEPSATELATVEQIVAYTPHIQQHAICLQVCIGLGIAPGEIPISDDLLLRRVVKDVAHGRLQIRVVGVLKNAGDGLRE